MLLEHLNLKIPIQNPDKLKPEIWNAVFQTWIQDQVCEELLIDVVDYLHVPEGPGMLLMGLEADYSLDNTDGVWGFKYNRKKPLAGSEEEQLRDAFQKILAALARLEQDKRLQGLEFNLKEVELLLNDRALSANTPSNQKALKETLEKSLAKVLKNAEHQGKFEKDSRKRLGVKISFKENIQLKN